MKRFSAVIFLALLGLIQPAFADDAKPAAADDGSARALAGKLIDLTNGKETIRAGFDQVMDGAVENMRQHGMPADGVTEIKAAIAKWYDTEINFEEIRPKMEDAYIKSFSADELKQLLAFYQSPLGAKAIKEMPSVMRDGAVAAEEYTKGKIATLNAQLTPILMKYRDQMEPAGGAGGGAPPPGN